MRGCFFKRGSTWTVKYDRPRDPITGKRRITTKSGFRTRKDAERWFANLATSLDQGTYVEASKQTLREFLEEWLPVIETRGLRPATRRSYRMLVEKQIVPRLGGIPLQKLSPAHLNAAYAEMLASGRVDGRGGLSARSVRYAHMVLRRALADAVRWNRLPRNVADSADPPSAKAARAKQMKTWSAEELAAFLASVRGDRLYAAYRLAATTGMRRGEVLGLRWCDVDLERGRLAVVQTLIAPDYEVQLSEPKTDKGRRSVPLDPGTVTALKEHAGQQAEERALFGAGYPEGNLVFQQPDGSPVHPHQFSQAFEQRVKEAKLQRIRLHDLRHTWATLAFQAGLHPKVVSEILGHSSVSVTLDTYSHAIPTLNETAVSVVAGLVLGQEAPPVAVREPAE